MLSLLISMLSYAIFVIFAGGAALRDASGSVVDLIIGNLTDCVANNYSCKYGLFNSYQVSLQHGGALLTPPNSLKCSGFSIIKHKKRTNNIEKVP